MLTDLRAPIVQAPMAGASSPEMAVAVCEAGGLGFLALGAMEAAAARAGIAEIRAGTDKPFGVNLFCHAPPRRNPARETAWLDLLRPDFTRLGARPPAALREIYRSFRVDDEMLAMLIETRPALVSFHFGLPRPDQIAALRAAGCLLWASATSLPEARAIRDAGLDAIVVQGWQAGGHRGVFDAEAPDPQIETLPLLRAVAPLGLPVIAAGGIMDRAGARAALAEGAAAVQCGTAFLLAPESLSSSAHRAALATGRTTITRAVSGRPARGVENRFTHIDGRTAPDYPIAYDAGKALNAAALAVGETGYGAFWAGTGAAQAVARPAAETLRALSP